MFSLLPEDMYESCLEEEKWLKLYYYYKYDYVYDFI